MTITIDSNSKSAPKTLGELISQTDNTDKPISIDTQIRSAIICFTDHDGETSALSVFKSESDLDRLGFGVVKIFDEAAKNIRKMKAEKEGQNGNTAS